MRFLETKRGNMWVGAILYYYSRAMFYMSVASFAMTAGTFWHTTFSQSYNMSIWVYIIGLLVLGTGTVAIDHYWLTPSLVAYSNRIGMEQNPILEQIMQIRKENKELKEMISNDRIPKK